MKGTGKRKVKGQPLKTSKVNNRTSDTVAKTMGLRGVEEEEVKGEIAWSGPSTVKCSKEVAGVSQAEEVCKHTEKS